MGWTPEHGFIKARWDAYSELMMVYLLASALRQHHVQGQLGSVDENLF